MHFHFVNPDLCAERLGNDCGRAWFLVKNSCVSGLVSLYFRQSVPLIERPKDGPLHINQSLRQPPSTLPPTPTPTPNHAEICTTSLSSKTDLFAIQGKDSTVPYSVFPEGNGKKNNKVFGSSPNDILASAVYTFFHYARVYAL